jgi:hypothetical protein
MINPVRKEQMHMMRQAISAGMHPSQDSMHYGTVSSRDHYKGPQQGWEKPMGGSKVPAKPKPPRPATPMKAALHV